MPFLGAAERKSEDVEKTAAPESPRSRDARVKPEHDARERGVARPSGDPAAEQQDADTDREGEEADGHADQ